VIEGGETEGFACPSTKLTMKAPTVPPQIMLPDGIWGPSVVEQDPTHENAPVESMVTVLPALSETVSTGGVTAYAAETKVRSTSALTARNLDIVITLSGFGILAIRAPYSQNIDFLGSYSDRIEF
jgi:hypothetical protein